MVTEVVHAREAPAKTRREAALVEVAILPKALSSIALYMAAVWHGVGVVKATGAAEVELARRAKA